MKQKKIPLRMCIGCMEMKQKSELIRVVREPEGTISLDLSGKKNGRGAYLCKSDACLKKAAKAKKLERTFATQIPDAVYEQLVREMEALETK